jgi:ornithine cyclodeaminase/alanine dehydrogenase-like protein (mu-crystallin family)
MPDTADIERGLKLVTRYPGREPALDSEILLHDLDSGECLALMDGDWITTMRTGAVAAHSITLLAKPGFTRVGFIGLGNTARSTLLCLRDHVPGKRLEIGLLRYKDQHEGFQQRFSSMRDVAFSEFDDVSEMAGWCDVLVSCVTAADGDFCEPDSFDPGTLVVPVHTRGFAGCDLVFDRVFVDDVAHVSDFKHFERFKSKMTETAEVVTGSKPGREDDAERILAYNIGIALHDIYFASRIEQLLEGCPGIDELPMGKPQEKFWV